MVKMMIFLKMWTILMAVMMIITVLITLITKTFHVSRTMPVMSVARCVCVQAWLGGTAL